MPGKKSGSDGGGWEYISALALLRKVSAAETPNAATIEAVAESVDLSTQSSGDNINRGIGNRLCLGILLPAGVTGATAQVFVDMSAPGTAGNKWAFVTEKVVTKSTHVSIQDIYPGVVKVLITAYAGAGDVEIVYGRTE